jgi:type I site-specific restriction endonuclease
MSNFQSNKTDGSESLFGEVIFSYTRAQAIADRVLIDVTPTALETGFRFPTAVTGNLMAEIETIPTRYSHEDVQGRLWDLMPSH